MSERLHDTGEEYLLKNNTDGVSFDILLFNNSTDDLSETDDIGDVTTEPATGNYSRQTQSLTATDNSGDWQLENQSSVTFDTTNTTETVDSYAVVKSFKASDTNDTSAQDHLIVSASLEQSIDLSGESQVDLTTGSVGVSLT